jgi:hypothetical protein
MMEDPTYNRREIDSNPIWKLAFEISEQKNDMAPLGWSRYIAEAKMQIGPKPKLELKKKKK